MNAALAQNYHLVDDRDIAAMAYTAVERSQSLGVKIGRTIRTWNRRVNDRRALARLNDRLLADAGLTRTEIERETLKYFWQE